jgi:hypothetical protein
VTEGTDRVPVRLHFASGKSTDTVLEADFDVSTDVEDFIEDAIKGAEGSPGHGKPRWTWIGDVYVYTQTIEGVQIL